MKYNIETLEKEFENFAKPLSEYIKTKHYKGDRLVPLDFVLSRLSFCKAELRNKLKHHESAFARNPHDEYFSFHHGCIEVVKEILPE